MADDPLSEGDQSHLYRSMLRGIANTAQDRLCAADTQHAWGLWTRYELKSDIPRAAPFLGGEPIPEITIRTRSERRCLNCGKVERD